jgi:hypothetical protein
MHPASCGRAGNVKSGFQAKNNHFLWNPLDPPQSGINLSAVAIKFGLNCSGAVINGCPVEYGNAIIVPPFTS